MQVTASKSQLRHFLRLQDLAPEEFLSIVARGLELKKTRRKREDHATLPGYMLGMLFEKSSTRTRVSFESGICDLGGHAIFLSPRDTHLGRGEPIEDSARVISRMVDIIVVRTFEQAKIERFAQYSSVPVINALTDEFHPCQVLADVQTYIEHRGPINGRRVAWVGDGNNMCNTLIEAAELLEFELRIAVPEGYEPDQALLRQGGKWATLMREPEAAVEGADLVITDVWASMGQEQEAAKRARTFAPFQLNAELMKYAASDALVMHCLPAHRGEEITDDVLEGPQSVVWDEAENRMHVQKALLEFLVAAQG